MIGNQNVAVKRQITFNVITGQIMIFVFHSDNTEELFTEVALGKAVWRCGKKSAFFFQASVIVHVEK